MHGLSAGFIASSAAVISQFPLHAVSTYLRNSSPQLMNTNTEYILRNKEEGFLDISDQDLRYMFSLLADSNVTIDDKKKFAHEFLTRVLKLDMRRKRLLFILGMVSILNRFSTKDISSCHILFTELIESIKAGVTPKEIARIIVRKILKLNKDIVIHPELLDLIDSKNNE